MPKPWTSEAPGRCVAPLYPGRWPLVYYARALELFDVCELSMGGYTLGTSADDRRLPASFGGYRDAVTGDEVREKSMTLRGFELRALVRDLQPGVHFQKAQSPVRR